MERRVPAGGQRRLENLRHKRNALRTRAEETRWQGSGSLGSADAAVLANAARRRQQQAYDLSSTSSSSSDGENDANGAKSPAPTSQELTAKLFAKLGIKGGGHKGSTGGFESDSSWASSPERSAHIRAVLASAENATSGNAAAHAELTKAQATNAALQQELAAARAQADAATWQLRETEGYAQQLEAQLHSAQSDLAAARSHAGGPDLPSLHPSVGPAGARTHPQLAENQEGAQQQLAANNWALQQQVSELEGQLASAAAWQQEVRLMQEQLGAMQAAVADSEVARRNDEQGMADQLRETEQALLATTARLAAAESQLAALQGLAVGEVAFGGCGLRPAGELLAELGVSHANLTAALAEAAALLA